MGLLFRAGLQHIILGVMVGCLAYGAFVHGVGGDRSARLLPWSVFLSRLCYMISIVESDSRR